MGLRLTTITAILYLCFTVVLISESAAQQRPFYQKSKPLTFIYKLSDATKPENIFYKHFLKALHPEQKTDNTTVTVTMKQWVKLYRKDNMVTVYVEMSDVQICCDSIYRGLNLKKELMPAKISCNVFALNKKTSGSFAFTNQLQLFANEKISFTAGTIKEKIRGDYQVDVKDVQLIFTPDQADALDKRLVMIDQYYSTAKELEKMIPLAEDIVMTDVDKLSIQRTKLAKADSLLKMVDDISFSFSLELEKNDPAGMIPKFKQLKEICTAKHIELDHMMAELPYQYYLSGVRNIKLGKTAEAKKFFNQSLTVNPLFSASLLQLALIDKAAGKMTDAEDKAKIILLKQKPDSTTGMAALSIVDQKLQRITDRISELLHAGKENDALAKVIEAENFIAEVPMLNGTKVSELKAKCYLSGYGRMLTNARALYAQTFYDKAESLLRNAMQYQQAHVEFIPSGGEAESLLRNILIKRYNALVQTGKTELLNKHYDKALAAFDIAIDYQIKYKLTANDDAEALKLRAERSVISDVINQALAASTARRMGEAKKIAMKAIDIARERDLLNDSDVSPKLKVLRETVFSKECLMAQGTYDDWHTTGKMAEVQKDFIGAHSIYARAQSYFNDYRECSLDAEDIEQDQSAINAPFIYQSMLLDVRALEDKMNYASAVYKFKEAGKFFTDQKIASFGLLHPHLADFALDNCSDAFLNYLAKYFTEKDEEDKSLMLYKALVDRKYYVKHPFSTGLFNLGSAMGIRDHLAGQAGKPKVIALQYVFDDSTINAGAREVDQLNSMYRPFVKGFLKGWKRGAK